MNVAYIRAGTEEQNPERQVELLKPYNIEKVFQDKQIGKATNREQLEKMLDFVREGDEVYVESWSRLSRSLSDLLKIIETFNSKKIRLVSIKENFDTSSPTSRLMLEIIASLEQFERENLLERQKEGIDCAKKKGVYKGRKPNKYDEEILKKVLDGISSKTMTVTEAAKILGVTRATVYNLLHKSLNRSDYL